MRRHHITLPLLSTSPHNIVNPILVHVDTKWNLLKFPYWSFSVSNLMRRSRVKKTKNGWLATPRPVSIRHVKTSSTAIKGGLALATAKMDAVAKQIMWEVRMEVATKRIFATILSVLWSSCYYKALSVGNLWVQYTTQPLFQNTNEPKKELIDSIIIKVIMLYITIFVYTALSFAVLKCTWEEHTTLKSNF